jgi:ATP-dependent protease ClpP protease subunit
MKTWVEIIGFGLLLMIAAIVAPFEVLAVKKESQVVTTTFPVDLDTDKVAFVYGPISKTTEATFYAQSLMTMQINTARVIFINSGGGDVDAGQGIINTMSLEQTNGTKEICIVKDHADSMAFNILTHCDVRLAGPNSTFLVHKVAWTGIDCYTKRCTAKYLKGMAVAIQKTDEPYRRANAQALGLTLSAYDKFTIDDHTWTTPDLLRMGYLQGLASIITN